MNAIETFDLRKVYDETKIAVEGLTLQVKRGEVFGYLGPNGAGKTTSIKMVLGLVTPTSGSGMLLGQPLGKPRIRSAVGFLPEHFRFHEWMQANEFLDLHGQLYGMSDTDRAARIPQLLQRVGLADVATKQLKTFSKGMHQRIGLAMALLPRPQIVFLDEPTSGLDPFGRLLVRDVIRMAKAEGTTVFLNSHLLSEVEATCDRVAFIRKGRVIKAGSMDELSGGLMRVRIKVGTVTDGLLEDLIEWGSRAEVLDDGLIGLTVPNEDVLPDLNRWMVNQGVDVFGISPHHLTLEELFIDIMSEQPSA